MMPLFPAHAFIKLAEQSMGRNRHRDQPTHASDPDQVLYYEALTPDPVFMFLRQLVHTGPIGSLVRRIDLWLEARDERRYGQQVDRMVPNGAREHLTPAERDRNSCADQDERIAA
jgi:hypothetical protein